MFERKSFSFIAITRLQDIVTGSLHGQGKQVQIFRVVIGNQYQRRIHGRSSRHRVYEKQKPAAIRYTSVIGMEYTHEYTDR